MASEKKTPALQSDMAGYAVGLVTWILVAGLFVVGKGTSEQMPAWTFAFWRTFLAALILVPLVRHAFPEIREFVRHHGPHALFIGGIGLGLVQGLIFTALDYTTAINTGIIMSTAPIITLIVAGLWLREPLGPWQVMGSVVAFAGIVVITVKGNLDLLTGLKFGIGDILVIVAACGLAAYTVLLRRAAFKMEQLPLLVVLMAGGAVASFPFFLYEVANGEHQSLNANGYLALAYAASFGGALNYLCYNWSIKILGAGRAGTLIYSQMVFTALLAWIFLGETIEWYHYLGSGLIIAGILVVSFLRPKPA